MSHPFSAVILANRLGTMNNFGALLSRCQRTPFIRVEGTALTQLRSVRRGGGDRRHSADFDEEETKRTEERRRDEHRHESSSAHMGSDPEQIQREFNAEFSRFLRQSFFSTNKNMTGKNFDEQLKEFIREFNKRMPEFEVEEQTNQKPSLYFILGGVGLLLLALYIGNRLLFWSSVLPEHRALVDQKQLAINFDQFVQDYLAAGEVRFVYFYPSKSVAVAILQPGAIIRGQPFYGSSVLIGLDSYSGSTNFLRVFEAAQNRLGIDPRDHISVAVQLPSLLPMMSLFLGWLILAGLFFKSFRATIIAPRFKVKRKDGKGTQRNK